MFDVLGKIAELRKSRDWSTYRLAKESDVSQSTIATWYGKNHLPPIDKLEKICSAMGTSLAEFFADEGTVPMTEETRTLLEGWRELTPEKRKMVLEYIEFMKRS